MTVIEFGKKDVRVNIAYIFLGMLVICSVIISIVMYNKVISLRHDVDSLESGIARQEVRNAELKEELYKKTDSFTPEAYLSERGYILDPAPQYHQASAISRAD